MVVFDPNAGDSNDPDGMPQLTVTPDIEGPVMELWQAPEQQGFIAYWVYGLPETGQVNLLDLKNLPDGMEVDVVVRRHGWTQPSITHYTSETAVPLQMAETEDGPVVDGTPGQMEAAAPVPPALPPTPPAA